MDNTRTHTRADEPIDRGKISLACGIDCCSILFISFARTAPLYVKNVCVCVCVCVCVRAHIFDYVHTVYELPLLPNVTASETFLHKLGAVRSVDWIFINRSPDWR